MLFQNPYLSSLLDIPFWIADLHSSWIRYSQEVCHFQVEKIHCLEVLCFLTMCKGCARMSTREVTNSFALIWSWLLMLSLWCLFSRLRKYFLFFSSSLYILFYILKSPLESATLHNLLIIFCANLIYRSLQKAHGAWIYRWTIKLWKIRTEPPGHWPVVGRRVVAGLLLA